MTNILDTLSNLTDLRNLHQLEAEFTSLVFQVSKGQEAILWRIEKDQDTLVLEQQSFAPTSARTACTPPLIQPHDLIELSEQRVIRRQDNDQICYLFSVAQGTHVAAVIEVKAAVPLSHDLQETLLLLIRVFGNYTDLLNYGQRDDLTGLRNRRSFDQDFANLTDYNENSIVIAVVDIDHFKRINDRFGHLYGDEVLILIARIMLSAFRKSDRVYRIGGEEFVIILHHTDLAGAERALNNFRKAVANQEFPQVGQVTISAGFSVLKEVDSASSVFGRADDALYIAKKNGRNQICCHETLVDQGVIKEIPPPSGTCELF